MILRCDKCRRQAHADERYGDQCNTLRERLSFDVFSAPASAVHEAIGTLKRCDGTLSVRERGRP